jgi:hypothetical protein
MSTELQKAASRINGSKSRGPITARGKRNSNRNNVRHGLVAETVVIDNESLPRFHALVQSLTADLTPQTNTEVGLVESMAVARWRQMRLWALEKSGLDYEIRQQDGKATTEDGPTRAFLAFRSLTDQSRSLELINRYETRHARYYLRLFRHFQNREKFPLEPSNPLETNEAPKP